MDVPARTALPGLGSPLSAQHLAHGRRLCGHCLPAVEETRSRTARGRAISVATKGWRRPVRRRGVVRSWVRRYVRGAGWAMVPLLTVQLSLAAASA